jgi:hypothetical protein
VTSRTDHSRPQNLCRSSGFDELTPGLDQLPHLCPLLDRPSLGPHNFEVYAITQYPLNHRGEKTTMPSGMGRRMLSGAYDVSFRERIPS